MIYLKPLNLLQCMFLLLLVFPPHKVTASKSHLDHPKYKHHSENLVKNKYIVKFSKSHDDAMLADTFLQSINQEFSNVDIRVLYKYKSSIFHGLSFHIDAPNNEVYSEALNAMMDHPDVESMHSQHRMNRSAVQFGSSAIDLAIEPTEIINPHHMTQVKRVHEELQIKGKGIFVAVIDDGIDYNHPALGGGYGKGFKVVTGYDLVGDNYDPDGDDDPVEDDDPFDSCPKHGNGHGTHISGIIAGYDPSKNFTGVTPEATLGMWRVFSCINPSVKDGIVLEALIRAYEAGADVINISIAAPKSWASSAISRAIDNVVSHGVVVVVAAGNLGTEGMYTFGKFAQTESAIAVASVENDYFYGPNFKASGIDTLIPYTVSYGNTEHFPSHSIPMVVPSYRNLTNNSSELCSEKNIVFNNDNVKDSLVLISIESVCAFIKIKIAQERNALGVILVNLDNTYAGSVSPQPNNITTLFISHDHGIALQEQYNATGTVRIKLSSTEGKNYLNRNLIGGTISGFSNVGPSAELFFMPQLSGVGGAILSTVPTNIGSWMITQGTSMSAPYVAGSIALYLAAHGKKAKEHPNFIKEMFMNYAKPANVYKSHDLDSPLYQGAGLVQVYDAITLSTHITPAKISFNDTATDLYKTHTLTINNWGSEEVTYHIHNNVSVAISNSNASNSLSYSSSSVRITASAGITFSTDTITVPTNAFVNVTVTVDLSDPSLHSGHLYYGGFIRFESQNSQQKDLSVPYFGVYGRQRDLPIFSSFKPVFLNDTLTSSTYFSNATNILKFDTSENSTIELHVTIVTPTRFLKCELIDAKGDVLGYVGLDYTTQVGRTVNMYYVNRNVQTRPEYKFGLDAYYVPPDVLVDNVALAVIKYKGIGRYRLSALKLFGNTELSEDWETWTSSLVEFV